MSPSAPHFQLCVNNGCYWFHFVYLDGLFKAALVGFYVFIIAARFRYGSDE